MNNRNIESIKKLTSPYELKNNLNLKYEDNFLLNKQEKILIILLMEILIKN